MACFIFSTEKFIGSSKKIHQAVPFYISEETLAVTLHAKTQNNYFRIVASTFSF